MANVAERTVQYTDKDIQTLSPREQVRLRPGMWIGKLGDGTQPDDGIYTLIKEVVDNSVDEYTMGFGSSVDITIEDKWVTIRDYGRGIPLDKVEACVGVINTSGKYDGAGYVKTVGLNGVGLKAVNFLSSHFEARSVRDGMARTVVFEQGVLKSNTLDKNVTDKPGTMVRYYVDEEIFGIYDYNSEYVEQKIKNYTYLNAGLVFKYNGKKFESKNGLLDLLNENLGEDVLYPPIHLKGHDIEIAFTHGTGYGETYFSFVNSQHTTQGGTHQAAFKDAVAKTIKEFFKKDYEPSDVRGSIIAAISVSVIEPEFESQTKIKLSSKNMGPGLLSVRQFIGDFVKEELDNYLHRHSETASAISKKIAENEKERKAISTVQKQRRELAKMVSLNNRKLRDCKIHYCDVRNPRKEESMIFITEGLSASGSITTSRDVQTQAVFSLRGKPKNCYGSTKAFVYQNEEFNLLQAALDIEESIDNLRYNKIIIATDADVDGMHIRLLLMSFFLQFFPDVIRQNHLFVLQTPLFRVQNRQQTKVIYCYNEEEKQKAMATIGPNYEVTRFKGLGEISAAEFKEFIGPNMRLEPVRISAEEPIQTMLEFYMGGNTPERQGFILDNLRIEADYVDELR